MRTMRREDVLPELEETVSALVRKVEVLGGLPHKEAIKIVASALRASLEDWESRAKIED